MCSLNTNSSRFHCLSARFLSISIAIVVSLVAACDKDSESPDETGTPNGTNNAVK